MLVLAHALALLVPAPLDIGWAGCPDVMASQVDARVVEEGNARRCGIGISIFGLELSIGGPECRPRRFIYPAHQSCLGTANEGTMCVADDALEVAEEKCECDRITLIGTGLTLPECVCEDAGSAGHIEDFKTVACSEDNRHGPLLQGR